MTETTSTEKSTAPRATSPGGQLSAAREERGLSLEQVADALRYSSRQLALLEADDYSGLPGATVVRGMVRAYAKHVGVDAEPLIDALRDRLTVTPVKMQLDEMAVPIVMSRHHGHRKYVLGSILIVGVGALMLTNWGSKIQSFLRDLQRVDAPVVSAESVKLPSVPAIESSAAVGEAVEPTAEPLPNDAPISSAPAASGTVPGASVATAPAAPLTSATATSAKPAATVAPPALAPVNPAASATVVSPPKPAAAGHKRIHLVFENESWVQIRSASGEILMNGINPAGTEQTVSGQPPFQVVIGAASGVQLRYNDVPFNLVPHTFEDVARITLN